MTQSGQGVDPAAPPDRLVTAVEERRPALVEAIDGARRRITLSLFRCNDPRSSPRWRPRPRAA